MTLKSFPRGGKKPDVKSTELLFNKRVKQKKRQKNKQKRISNGVEGIKEDTNLIADTAERLSNATLQEGMIVLGRISEISEYGLRVSLPGSLIGQIQVTDLSESYNSLLQNVIKSKGSPSEEFKPLAELYRPGDYVVCYVKSIKLEGKWRVRLSLEPQLLNQNVDSSYLTKGSRIVCTISSIEDHGYVVETGVSNIRAFIDNNDVDSGKQYFPGKQLMCTIKEIKTVENVSTVALSAKQKKVTRPSTCNIDSLDVLMPGIRLELIIKKILSNGLQVSFGQNNIGYINQIYLDKPLATYTINMEVVGELLYIMPTVKFAYFSLLTDKSEEEKLEIGEIKQNATVLFRESNGIVLLLAKGIRGIVSIKRTEVDFNKISTKFVCGSKHRCRILLYNWMEKLYVCTMQREILEQKYFSFADVKPGDIVHAKITNIKPEIGFIIVQIGKMIGSIAPEHISDLGLSALNKFKIGQRIKAMILSIDHERNMIKFTLKQSLIKSALPILHNIHDAKCGAKHLGTIVQINRGGVLVQFFGDLKGWIPSNSLDKNTRSTKWNFSIGQTIMTKIETVDKGGKITLGLANEETSTENISEFSEFSIGDTVEGTVTESTVEGVYLKISKNNKVVTAFLPAGHMAPCAEIAGLLASKCIPGDVLSGLVFATVPSLILTRTFLSQEQFRNFDLLKIGDCIPCSIRDISSDGLRVILPIEHYKSFGFVPFKNVSNYQLLHANQILFTKIISINKKEKQLGLSMLLKKIWDNGTDKRVRLLNAVDVLSLYFNKLQELASNSFYNNRPISTVSLGQKVSGTVEKITEHGLVVRLENNVTATVRKDHYKQEYNVGNTISGSILWINYVHEFVDLTTIPLMSNQISGKQRKLPNLPEETVLRGEIVLVTNWFILILLKGRGRGSLAALPARRHINDVQPDLTPYVVGAKVKCYVVLNRNESDVMPICMLKSVFEARKSNTDTDKASKKNDLKRKKSWDEEDASETKKKKPEEVESTTAKKKRKENSKESLNKTKQDKKEPRSETDNSAVETRGHLSSSDDEKSERIIAEVENVNENSNDENPTGSYVGMRKSISFARKSAIPECGFFWDNKPVHSNITDTSNDDSEDETEQQAKQKRKKKLNAVERKEMERQKEREIREREEALASNQMPNSVDQFDRLVLSSPDSSLVWLQYMAFHLQATEIEKARAVARRAIKTINFREENEKLNVWNAWLNLESKFGTRESLNDVFQEAIRTNDALKIYTHMLTVHVEAGRQVELEKIIGTMIGKFKQNPQVWIDCGNALLKIGLKEKSRHIMQRALQSLPAPQHVNLMVKFAILENRFGERERSQTLFEQILSSYPKRVDVWSSYVDSLVKSDDIDLARKVLERATVQTLPPRKMKTLFKKFISFEERHGTPDGVARVQRMAAEYVENQCNNESVV